jgi:hypothetical protein
MPYVRLAVAGLPARTIGFRRTEPTQSGRMPFQHAGNAAEGRFEPSTFCMASSSSASQIVPKCLQIHGYR